MAPSSSPPSSESTATGASKFLANLPNRGLLSSSTVPSTNLGGMRVYICEHDTSPPVGYAMTQQPPIYTEVLEEFWTTAKCRLNEITFTLKENQLIKTNEMNILIRSLVRKKRKVDLNSKDAKGVVITEGSRKRVPERGLEGRTPSKRGLSSTQNSSQPGGSESRAPEKDLQSLTVERLRALLKEKGLSSRGKKDELIARLRGLNG